MSKSSVSGDFLGPFTANTFISSQKNMAYMRPGFLEIMLIIIIMGYWLNQEHGMSIEHLA